MDGKIVYKTNFLIGVSNRFHGRIYYKLNEKQNYHNYRL